MTLLTISQAAFDRVGVPRQNVLAGSSDQQARIMFALLNQEGRDLVARHSWQRLTKEKTFSATATETQAGVVPADFDRFIDGTFWNRDENRRVIGPVSAQDWQGLKASNTLALYDSFRQRGGDVLMIPTPSAGASYAYEYVSKYWVGLVGASVATADAFANDDDQSFLPEELLILGGTWRYLRSRGLDYSEAFRSYEMAVNRRIGRDGGSATLNMTGPSDKFPAPRATIPDGSWNL